MTPADQELVNGYLGVIAERLEVEDEVIVFGNTIIAKEVRAERDKKPVQITVEVLEL